MGRKPSIGDGVEKVYRNKTQSRTARISKQIILDKWEPDSEICPRNMVQLRQPNNQYGVRLRQQAQKPEQNQSSRKDRFARKENTQTQKELM